MLKNDRLSHWCVGAVLSWTTAFFLIGLPIFHFWLQASIKKIALFTVLACVLQLAVTPWLFEARASAQNPTGIRSKRTAAVVIWLSLLIFLFNCFVLRDAAPDFGARVIFLGGPILLGTLTLIIRKIVVRKRDD
ncbi:MAG TPA: hypothetical protein VIB39_18430 [Candidatus Angelobacter sp.]|jgi:hypothetical protein